MLVNFEQELKQELPKNVTEEGIAMLVKPTHSLKALSPKAVTGNSVPSLAVTFSGTTTSPEYFASLLATTVAVFASLSSR